MGDGVGVRRLEFEELRVDVPKEQSRDQLPQFGHTVVVFHEDRAGDDKGEVEFVHVHLAAPSELPEHGEEDAAGAVPAEVERQQQAGYGGHAEDLEFPVEGLDGQVGHEFVLANDQTVVDEEGRQAADEAVLDEGDLEELGNADVEHDESWAQQAKGQFRERDARLGTELLVLVVPVGGGGWAFGGQFGLLCCGADLVVIGEEVVTQVFAHVDTHQKYYTL